MMNRRWLLLLMGASVISPSAYVTPVEGAAIGSNTRKFRERHTTKQAEKQRAKKEKIEKEKEEQGEEKKEEKKSGE